MQRRLAEREIEIEMDNRDRQKEREEIEDLKKKIYSGDSSNPDYEFAEVCHRFLTPSSRHRSFIDCILCIVGDEST